MTYRRDGSGRDSSHRLARTSPSLKGKSSHGHANTNTTTGPDRRGQAPGAARVVRRRAGGREESAGECAEGAEVASVGDTATAGGRRRPGRHRSRQGFGVDHPRPARTRRRETTARVPAVTRRVADDEVPRGLYFIFLSARAMATMEF